MLRRLIINADDFGLTTGINRAVAELHDSGVLTSATLMAAGPAFEDAVRVARARPKLGVGCHIVLTDGVPISPLRKIPSLVSSKSHTFRPKLYTFLAALLAKQIDPDEIESEAVAQIRQLQQAGIHVTHLDAHKHTHIFPVVMAALLRAARQTGVHAIRNPFEQPWAFPLSNGTLARTSQIRLLRPLQKGFYQRSEIQNGRIRTTDGTVGISATGHLDIHTLQNLLGALPEGTWELVCHPGYNDADLEKIPTRLRTSRDVERNALLSVLGTGQNHPFSESQSRQGDAARHKFSHPPLHPALPQLIHYGDLTTRDAS